MLIIGSGSFTHDLRRFRPNARLGAPETPDVTEFSEWMDAHIRDADIPSLINYRELAPPRCRPAPHRGASSPALFRPRRRRRASHRHPPAPFRGIRLPEHGQLRFPVTNPQLFPPAPASAKPRLCPISHSTRSTSSPPKPLRGNPLAVVLNADSLTTEQMAAFANWTNLSETTFILKPTISSADYRVRIFTPSSELPFAGHPTLGSCHVWLTAGGKPREAEIIQQCDAGLIRIRRDGRRLAFAAPPLRRDGPLDAKTTSKIAKVLRIPATAILRGAWADNGPGWAAIMLASRDELLALKPDFYAMAGLNIGVIAPAIGEDFQFEVRAFVPEIGVPEDPVTGSLNAALAQWFFASGLAPAESYIVAQGTALARAGRVHISRSEAEIWVGGDTITCITGTLKL